MYWHAMSSNELDSSASEPISQGFIQSWQRRRIQINCPFIVIFMEIESLSSQHQSFLTVQNSDNGEINHKERINLFSYLLILYGYCTVIPFFCLISLPLYQFIQNVMNGIYEFSTSRFL